MANAVPVPPLIFQADVIRNPLVLGGSIIRLNVVTDDALSDEFEPTTPSFESESADHYATRKKKNRGRSTLSWTDYIRQGLNQRKLVGSMNRVCWII